jgi:hypothetical protein
VAADRILLITLDEWYVDVNLNWVGSFDFDWGYTVEVSDRAGTQIATFKDSGEDVVKEHAIGLAAQHDHGRLPRPSREAPGAPRAPFGVVDPGKRAQGSVNRWGLRAAGAKAESFSADSLAHRAASASQRPRSRQPSSRPSSSACTLRVC